MKKLLYGTTALIAAGALATGASAAEKVKMGVGGYMQAFFVVADQDEEDTGQSLRDHAVAREGEIIFNGTTTLDNGLKVGAQVQLEAEVCGDQIDESFVFFEGGWGRINIGSENSAAYLMHYSAPAPSHWAHGLQSSNFSHLEPGTNVVGNFIHTNMANMTSDSEKITYFTPRLSGFQFGVSYTPDRCEEAQTCGGSYSGFENDDRVDGTDGEAIEVGVNYIGSFNDLAIRLSGSYGTFNEESGAPGRADYEEYGGGGQLAWGGFTLGAGWRHSEDDNGVRNVDRDDISVGVRYASGPWGVGVQYSYVEKDNAALGGDDEVDAIEVGGSYTLGPGVLLSAGVQYWDWDSDNGGATDKNDGWVGFIGTHIAF